MFEDFVFFSPIVDKADIDYSGGRSHVGGTQTAEVFETLPTIDKVVGLPLFRNSSSLLVLLAKFYVVPKTDVRQKELLKFEVWSFYCLKF
jgi:hypothetical protein